MIGPHPPFTSSDCDAHGQTFDCRIHRHVLAGPGWLWQRSTGGHYGGDGNPLGIGLVGVSLAFGLTVLTGAYALGHIPGGHFNPAVSFGLWAGGRFAAGFLLLQVASGQPGFTLDPAAAGNFASNGFDALSPGGYSLLAAFITEVVLTAMFLVINMGATHGRVPAGFAPIAIGLTLTLIHLISIPVTNTSVNPARSTAVAVFAGSGAMGQLWLFWLAPIIGGLAGGGLYRWLGQAPR